MSERYRRLLTYLRAARRRAGITQIDLARRLKRSQSFVSKYEGGEQQLSLIEFAEIGAALKVECGPVLEILHGGATPDIEDTQLQPARAKKTGTKLGQGRGR